MLALRKFEDFPAEQILKWRINLPEEIYNRWFNQAVEKEFYVLGYVKYTRSVVVDDEGTAWALVIRSFKSLPSTTTKIRQGFDYIYYELNRYEAVPFLLDEDDV